jgi:NAD(P)H-hydrate epimerase
VIPVVSCAQSRAFDARALACGVSSLVLMENAGRGALDAIEREPAFGPVAGRTVLVVAGAGNNGGDGFVVARHGLTRGARVVVWFVGDETRRTPACAQQAEAFIGVGGRVEPLDSTRLESLHCALAEADVVVDALFGTGLTRPIEPATLAGQAIGALLGVSPRVVALDVPSGMDADTGAGGGACVNAAFTVTFGHLKRGLVTAEGASLAGVVRVADIGVPAALLETSEAGLCEPSDVLARMSPRPLASHKYRAGAVVVVGGSVGKVGAALLAARGAFRAGAGLVSIASSPATVASLDARVLEVMTRAIAVDGDVEAAVLAALEKARSVVVGPGLGSDAWARRVVTQMLATYKQTLVLDADALSMHAGNVDVFAGAVGTLILTPHSGELARLLGTTADDVDRDRFAAVAEASRRARAVVVLKGPFSLIASPEGRVVVNPTGNAALATAGSGDVLAGIIAALACTLTPFEAAWCGAYLHGAVGDVWRRKFGDTGLLARAIADGIPHAVRALRRSSIQERESRTRLPP